MSNKKEDRGIQTQEVKTEVIHDKNAVLTLFQVHAYTDRLVDVGHAEYEGTAIKVRSQHPLDQCLKRGIIEQDHQDIGKRLRNYRDCALSKLIGRTYNATCEGDSEMDAATIYASTMRQMCSTPGGRSQWKLIGIVCFAEPNIDGVYMSERDYGSLYALAPNLQYGIETVGATLMAVSKELEEQLKALKSDQNCLLALVACLIPFLPHRQDGMAAL